MFCYAPTTRVESWKPDLTVSGSLLDSWVVKNFDQLGAMFPFGEGRVQLGLAFDGLMLPREQVVSLYQKARKLGAKVITSHHVRTFFGKKQCYSIFRVRH